MLKVTTAAASEDEQETVRCRTSTCVYIRTYIPTSCSVLLSHLLAQWRVEVRQAVDWTVGDVVLLPATPPQ